MNRMAHACTRAQMASACRWRATLTTHAGMRLLPCTPDSEAGVDSPRGVLLREGLDSERGPGRGAPAGAASPNPRSGSRGAGGPGGPFRGLEQRRCRITIVIIMLV